MWSCRGVLVPALFFASTFAAGCASSRRVGGVPTIPSTLSVRGVAAKPGRGGAQIPLDARKVAGDVERTLKERGTFWFPTDGARPKGRPEADYVLEIEPRGRGFDARVSHVTGMAALSSVVWFLTVFPAWWIPDRVYDGSDVELVARVAPSTQRDATLLQHVAGPYVETLDLWSRGVEWQFLLSLFLPPFWMDDPPTAEIALAASLSGRAGVEIAEEIERDWPVQLLRSGRAYVVLGSSTARLPDTKGEALLEATVIAPGEVAEVEILDGSGRRRLARIDGKSLALLTAEDATSDPSVAAVLGLLQAGRVGQLRILGLEQRLFLPDGDTVRVVVRGAGNGPESRFTIDFGER